MLVFPVCVQGLLGTQVPCTVLTCEGNRFLINPSMYSPHVIIKHPFCPVCLGASRFRACKEPHLIATKEFVVLKLVLLAKSLPQTSHFKSQTRNIMLFFHVFFDGGLLFMPKFTKFTLIVNDFLCVVL